MTKLTKKEIKEFLLKYFSESTSYYWINGEVLPGPYDPENFINGEYSEKNAHAIGKFLLEKLCWDMSHTAKYDLGYWTRIKNMPNKSYFYTRWDYCTQEQRDSEEAKKFATSLMLMGL